MFAIPRRPDASETIFGDRLAAATRQYATKTPTVRLVRSTPKGGRPRRGSRRALDGGQAPILGLFQHYRPKAVQRHVRSHLASAAARQREVLEQLGGTRWHGTDGLHLTSPSVPCLEIRLEATFRRRDSNLGALLILINARLGFSVIISFGFGPVEVEGILPVAFAMEFDYG
jgi:hypothetical protein